MSGDAGAGGGKDIQAAGLDGIAKGINLTLGELKELGVDSMAGQGRGFSELSLSGLDLGHDDLKSAFSTFCERWEWGVRALVEEGSLFAHHVGLAAGTLYERDEYVGNSLKIAASSAWSNPHLSEDEAMRQGWGDIFGSGVDSLSNPDYSRESWDEAKVNIEQGWNDAARDVLTQDGVGPVTSPLNLQQSTGATDEQTEAMLDAAFGPSAEERAQAAAPQQTQQQAPHPQQGGKNG
ncbi:hypothetical protein [Streptomyces sp. ALI-76-A]|uniref:hypothetical protein n=1 Tax=Streptomyces sp. ALI-76-A TaxID=3025736 RepID=UPI00256EF6D7|nr:hypothetical protein [Streptomyces sp. ALI-76-A]MDL5203536.1 hypothetical protein [Streptomyces sp. ALI-76-A]